MLTEGRLLRGDYRHKRNQAGSVNRCHKGRLHHIGVGRIHHRTRVLILVQDSNITIINAATGEVLRQLTLDPTRDYKPTGAPKGPTRKKPQTKNRFRAIPMSCNITFVAGTGFEPATSGLLTRQFRWIPLDTSKCL